jgi:hypothetical protein
LIAIKDEIKFLYIKKMLNRELHCIHLHAAKQWGQLKHVTECDINLQLNQKLEKNILPWIKNSINYLRQSSRNKGYATD